MIVSGSKSCINLDRGLIEVFEREYYKGKSNLVKSDEISKSFKRVIKDISKK